MAVPASGTSPVSDVHDDLHSARCRKSSHIRSSVSDSGLALSESCVLWLELRELRPVPCLVASWGERTVRYWHLNTFRRNYALSYKT